MIPSIGYKCVSNVASSMIVVRCERPVNLIPRDFDVLLQFSGRGFRESLFLRLVGSPIAFIQISGGKPPALKNSNRVQVETKDETNNESLLH